MGTFNPYPYSVKGPTGGGGMMPQPAAPMEAAPPRGDILVAHSREIDLRAIAGDVDPPVASVVYQHNYLMLHAADCAPQRLRLSADRNGTQLSMAFNLIQFDRDGKLQVLVPRTEVRTLDVVPTDYESVSEIDVDVPILLHVWARYQLVRLFATLEVLYTSVEQ